MCVCVFTEVDQNKLLKFHHLAGAARCRAPLIQFQVFAHSWNRLTASGFGLNDHYRRIWNDKYSAAICGANPINIMNLSTVQYVLV